MHGVAKFSLKNAGRGGDRAKKMRGTVVRIHPREPKRRIKMSFKSCPNCHKLLWRDEGHACHPFEYRMDYDKEDEWQTEYGPDQETVAEKIVEAHWEESYVEPHKVDETVVFKDGKKFNVTAEAQVNFRAKEVK